MINKVKLADEESDEMIREVDARGDGRIFNPAFLIVEIPTLERVEVNNLNQHLEKSANMALGNDTLQVGADNMAFEMVRDDERMNLGMSYGSKQKSLVEDILILWMANRLLRLWRRRMHV